MTLEFKISAGTNLRIVLSWRLRMTKRRKFFKECDNLCKEAGHKRQLNRNITMLFQETTKIAKLFLGEVVRGF